MPSVTLSRPFSTRFRSSQRDATSSGTAHRHVAEHVRVATDELVAHAVGDGGEVEVAVFVTELRVKDDLKEKITKLLFDVVDHVSLDLAERRSALERLQGVDRLVGLFEQVARE